MLPASQRVKLILTYDILPEVQDRYYQFMLGEMVQYKNFHDDPTQPPFPWDPEAARWCRGYRASHPDAFPVDSRELLRPERVKLGAPSERKKPRVRLK